MRSSTRCGAASAGRSRSSPIFPSAPSASMPIPTRCSPRAGCPRTCRTRSSRLPERLPRRRRAVRRRRARLRRDRRRPRHPAGHGPQPHPPGPGPAAQGAGVMTDLPPPPARTPGRGAVGLPRRRGRPRRSGVDVEAHLAAAPTAGPSSRPSARSAAAAPRPARPSTRRSASTSGCSATAPAPAPGPTEAPAASSGWPTIAGAAACWLLVLGLVNVEQRQRLGRSRRPARLRERPRRRARRRAGPRAAGVEAAKAQAAYDAPGRLAGTYRARRACSTTTASRSSCTPTADRIVSMFVQPGRLNQDALPADARAGAGERGGGVAGADRTGRRWSSCSGRASWS